MPPILYIYHHLSYLILFIRIKCDFMSNLVTPEARLEELGLKLPDLPPPPAAVYVPFKISGQQLWIAGQIPMHNGQLICSGIVGQEVSLADAQTCAQRCAVNIFAQARLALGDLQRIRQVIKLNVFVASHPQFTQQQLVANHASNLMQHVLGEAGIHARSAVGVASLPLNSPVEIDATLEIEMISK